MNKLITINKDEFKVKEKEFKKLPHEEFNNLNIYDSLGLFERIISLINELSLLFTDKPNIHFINITHGGFIPIKCSKYAKNISIYNDNNDQDKNILTNIYKHSIENINLMVHKQYDNKNIVFSNNSEPVNYNTEIIINRQEEIILNKTRYKLKDTEYNVFIDEKIHEKFIKEFYYFIEDDFILNYDNLIHYTMIIKNGGDSLEDILINNLKYIDRWTILDTGSTDNTINIINKVLVGKKKGNLYEEPFINFKDSRNRCLDLAGDKCKFSIMLDDTYMINGNLREFLNTVRGDQFSDSFSLFIRSDDVCYASNRILKTDRNLRYIYKIHEVITPKDNKNVIVPFIHSNIFDYRSDYMENRTMSRKEYDLKILFEEIDENPNDPRALYYVAQTYNLLEKHDLAYEYYIKRVDHPEEGFLQEKIDACFEAARMANFHLNKPWDECEKLYIKSYEMDKTRPDSLYFIGIHYYLLAERNIDKEKNYSIAFENMKKCFEIGYPEHCQYSLKPSLHYYFLPKFLAHLSYIYKDYITGYKCTSLFLEKTQIIDGKRPFKECFNEIEYKTVLSWNSIFNLMIQIPKDIIKKPNKNNLPYLVFMEDGGFNSWTGRDITKKGMGGAETFTIEMARYLQKSGYFQVIVFCRCDENDIFEGVEYRNIHEYFTFVFEYDVHTCIIGRYSEYLPYTLESNVENVYMIAHDLDFTGNIIPLHTKLKKIFCLSEWHVNYFINIYPSLKDITFPFYYGIDFNLFNSEINKIPYKFIYSSFPIRGLLPLLQMWPKILDRYPKATLHIHSDINGEWSNNMRPDEMKLIKDIFKEYISIPHLNNSIVYKGWTSKKELADNWMSSDICFYPCTYLETFCHTALEAAISKTLIITTKLGALENTVGTRGILLDGNFYDIEFQNKALEEVFKIIENKELKNTLINKNYEWAKNMSWKLRTDILIKDHLLETIRNNLYIKNIDNRLQYCEMYNWTNDIPTNSYNHFIKILEYIKWKHSGNEINVLEIGTYTGTSIIKILELLPNSKGTVIDTWKNYDEYNKDKPISYLQQIENNNIEKIFNDNIRNAGIKDMYIFKGDSANILNDLIINNKKFDFIYIDGSHTLMDSYTDLILSFNLLNTGGIIGLDDYVYNNDKIFESPFIGINYFIEKFKNKIKVLHKEYRVFIEKL